MSLQCGIVGLPNVGKSTLFNALTKSSVASENYPFCTIEPNTGVVALQDPRLDQLASLFKPEKTIPTAVEFVDIAGLVAGASKGEGLGNQFLGHIRSVQAIAHVVRCFNDDDVVHVDGRIDPLADIETIETELMLADLETLKKMEAKYQKIAKSGDKESKANLDLIESLTKHLDNDSLLYSFDCDDQAKKQIKNWGLITAKPQMYVCNVGESELNQPNPNVDLVMERANKMGFEVVVVCAHLESEMAQLSSDELPEFLNDYGLKRTGLSIMSEKAYALLNLVTFFTAGPKEVRAWTIRSKTLAPQAAGAIHTDFERGFIRCDVYTIPDIVEFKSEAKLKEAGKIRLEGKDYVVQDGDVVHFRFNVS